MRVLVLGGAVSGRAAAAMLAARGHEVVVFDERPLVGETMTIEGVATITGHWEAVIAEGADLVVTSPGFSPTSAPIADIVGAGVPLWSEIELAAREIEAPVAAVTGTNGKTTVTELTAEMLTRAGLRAPAVGNIGRPLVEVLGEELDAVVIEASSFQLYYTHSLRPRVAVVMNVAPDHLDWHGTVEHYAQAKARIFMNQDADDLAVFSADDEGASRLAADAPGRQVPISGLSLPAGGAGRDGDRLVLPTGDVPLADLRVDDAAYLVDIAAAAVAAAELGASHEAIVEVARRFTPGLHRRTRIGEWNGITWVDDSKATNPHAALAAIQAYPSVVLIAGGRNKGLDLRPLPAAPNVRFLLAIGEAAPELMAAAGGTPARAVSSMEEAVRIADAVAVSGDTVLLAPGCASFDMFSSYGERGDVFAAAVRSVKEAA
jgi:UDP-N-acetylmuramoylalanine--D-glutamate ligase